MNPAGVPLIPLPEPLPLPAPVWLLWFLLTLTFTVHVVAMNLLVGGSVIAVDARLRHRTNEHARELVALLVRAAPILMAATVTFGVAPLLFLQVLYGRLFFVSSVLMAWIWLAVVPALIVAYYAAYALAFRPIDARPSPAWLHLLIVAILLAVGLVYTTNMTLMLRADRFGAMYAASGRGLQLNFGDPTLWIRWLHMMLGAFAVAGLAIVFLGLSRRSKQPEAAAWLRGYGARWAATSTAINTIVGSLWLTMLPGPLLARFIASDATSAAILAAGFVAGLATAGLLIALALPGASPQLAVESAIGLGVTTVAMILTRDELRRVALAQVGFTPVSWVVPQWGTIVLFAVCLVAAIAIVTWMVWALVRSVRSETGGDQLGTRAKDLRPASAA